MIVIGRTRTDEGKYAQEEIDIVGSTGNLYRVTIGQVARCTCPDHVKGHECKHKVYALNTVLKAPAHLQYQLAFLSGELEEIFDQAPPIPGPSPDPGAEGHRKSTEGECPICYTDLDPENNRLVWCKAACGNNMHQSCFDRWAAHGGGGGVACVLCRTPWVADHGDLASILQAGTVGEDGYINVAHHFGLSGVRDYSSYNSFSRRAMGQRG